MQATGLERDIKSLAKYKLFLDFCNRKYLRLTSLFKRSLKKVIDSLTTNRSSRVGTLPTQEQLMVRLVFKEGKSHTDILKHYKGCDLNLV